MKMKKFISFLCAAALSVSSFAGLTVTASAAAADTVAITPTVGSKTVTVKQEGTTATQGVLLHAVYANGALTSVESKPIPATETGDAPVEYTKADYAAYASGTGSKILAWKSLQGMEPITVNIVEPPAAKTQVSTVADLTVAASNNNKAPATITATVAAKTGQTFTDTAAFTYAWTKDGVDSNTRGATIENAAAGTYTVTATYNGTGDYEGSLGPATITITAADETRTNLSGATVALDKQTATVGDTVTATVTIGNEHTNITDSADLTYQWYKAGETPTAVQGATEKTYTTTEAGTFYVTVSAAQASTTYVGTTNSGNVVVSEPVQAEPYVSALNGKIKAISVMGLSGKVVTGESPSDGTDVSDKTYKELKEMEAVSPEVTRNQNGQPQHAGGQTKLEEGVILANGGTDAATALIEVDVTDYVASAATDRITLSMASASTSTVNAKARIAKLTEAPSKEIGSLTYDDVSALTAGTAAEIGNINDATLKYNMEDDIAALGASDAKTLYYLVTVENGRETKLSDFAISTKTYRTVTVNQPAAGGTIAADKTKVVEGDEITLSNTPTDDTYDFGGYTVTKAGGGEVEVTNSKFTMPDENVTVTGSFTKSEVTKYDLKVAGVAGYARIYTADSQAALDALTQPTAWTNHLGQVVKTGDGATAYASATGVTAGDTLGKAADKSKVYYKVEKAGYTTATGSVDVDGADATINVASTLTPTEENVIYYENGDYVTSLPDKTGNVMGSLHWRSVTAGKFFEWQSGDEAATLNTTGLTSSHYKLTMPYVASTATNSGSTNYTISAGSKTLAIIALNQTTTTLYIGSTSATGTATASVATSTGKNFVLEVDGDNVTLSYDTAKATGTVSGAGMVTSISEHTMKQRLGVSYFKIENVPAPAKTPLTGVTLAAKTDATGGTDVADANITVGTVLTATIEPANATGVTYEWFRGDEKIADATSATYTVTADDQGKTIKVVAKDDSLTANIQATKAIPAAAPTKTAIGGTVAVKNGTETVTTAYVNDELTADVTAVTPSGATVSYQWQKQQGTGLGSSELVWTNLSDTGADTATYTPSSAGLYKVVVTGTGNYEGTVESASITVAARPTATVNTTKVANAHDNAVSDPIPDADLYDADSVAITPGTADNGYATYAVKVDDLKSHTAGNGMVQHWLGVVLTLANVDNDSKVYTGRTPQTENTWNTDASEDTVSDYLKDPNNLNEFSEYANLDNKDDTTQKPRPLYIVIENKSGDDFKFKFTFDDVTFYTAPPAPAVTAATLHDQADTANPESTPYTTFAVDTEEGDDATTIKLTATDLALHKNAQNVYGYWVGALITAPEGKKIVGEYFSATAFPAEIEFHEIDARDSEPYYVNVGGVNNYPEKKYLAVKLNDDSVYKYVFDTMGVKTVAAAPTVSAGTLADKSATNPIASADLYEAGSYSVTAGLVSDNVIPVTVAIKNLKAHENDYHVKGFWVGTKIIAPTGLKITKYYFGTEKNFAEWTEENLDITEEPFYTNVGGSTEKKHITVQLSDGKAYSYEVDVQNVVRAFNITAANVEGSYTFANPTPTSAAEKSTVNIEVTPAGNKALTGITVTKTGTNETVPVANGDQTGKYSFTMPSSDVTITANVSETSEAAPALVEISPKAVTAKQGDNVQFTRTVRDASGNVTNKNTVNYDVYTDAETQTDETKSKKSTVGTEGLLRIGKDEESEKLYVVATHYNNTALKDTAVVTVERNEGNVTLQFYKGDGTTPAQGLTVTATEGDYVLNSSEPKTAMTTYEGKADFYLNMNKSYNFTVTNNGVEVATIENFVPSKKTADTDRTVTIPYVTSTADSAQGVYDLSNKIEGDKVVITPDKVVLTAKYTPVDGEAADMTYDAENNELYFLMPEKGVSNVTLSYVETDSFGDVIPTITIGNDVVKKIKTGDKVTVQLSNTDDKKKYAVNYAYSTGSDTEVSSVVNQRATQASNGTNMFTFTVPNIPEGNNLRLFLTVRQQLTSAVITGDVVVGGTLTAVPQYTAADGTQTAVSDTTGFTYEWWLCDANGTTTLRLDCTEKTYTVVAGTANAYLDKYIKVIATAPDTSDYYDKVSAVTETAIINNIFNITNEVNNKRYTVDYPADIKTDEGAVSTYGETVTFTVTPKDNYALSDDKMPSVKETDGDRTVKVTKVAGEEYKYSFTMPAYNVTIDPTDAVSPTTKWTAMSGVSADDYTLTASTDNSSEDTKDDVVTTFTIPAGTTPAFTFNLDHELGANAPENWNAGEITVSYDLKIDGDHIDKSGKWFMDLSTANEKVARDDAEDLDYNRFGRMGGLGNKLFVIGGFSDSSDGAKFAYTEDNGLNTNGEWKKVTYKVDLKNQKVFAVSYDDQTHSVLMTDYNQHLNLKFNASNLYLNLGMTSGIDSASTIKVKNVHVEYKGEPTSYTISKAYPSSDKFTFADAEGNPIESAKAGDEVKIIAPTATNETEKSYKLDSDNVSVPGAIDLKVADGRKTATFIMPMQNVTVTAPLKEIFNVNNLTPDSAKATNYGYVTVSPATAAQGDTVTVTVTPLDNSYKEKNFFVCRKGTESSISADSVEGGYTFIMPDYEVDVRAVFEKKTFTVDAPVNGAPGYTTSLYIGDDDTQVTDTLNNYKYGTKATYKVAPSEGYEITQVVFNDTTYTGTADVEGESKALSAQKDAEGKYVFAVDSVTSNISAPEVKAEKIPYEITKSFESSKGDFSVRVNDTAKLTANKGDTITILPDPKDGYEVNTVAVAYEGDTENPIIPTEGTAGTYTFTMPAAPVTIAVTFKAQEAAPATYEVIFNLNEGSVALKDDDGRTAETEPVKVTVNAGEPVATADVPKPTRAGHILYGWKLDGTENVYDASGIHSMTVNSATSYTAQWTPVYEITLPTGLTGGEVTASATSDLAENTPVTLTVDPEDGYQLKTISATYGDNQTVTLTGPTAVENSDNTTYTFEMPEGNVTVAAEFERTPHTVTLNAGDGAFAADAVTSLTVADGAKISTATELVSGSLPTPTKADYTFVGWKKGSTETVIADNTALADETVDADITYTAQFIQSYVLTSTELGDIKAVTLTTGDADKTYAQLRSAGSLNENELKIHQYNKGFQGNYTVVQVDASKLIPIASQNRIFLGFTVPKNTSYNASVFNAKLSTPSVGIAELTSAEAVKATLSGTSTEKWSSKSEDIVFTRDIQSDVLALENDDTLLYYVIYTGTAREQKVTNFTLTTQRVYDVIIDSDISGGTVVSDVSQAAAGETVTLTVTPDDGYDLVADSLKVNNGAVSLAQSGTKYTFEMPEGDATVTANFAVSAVQKYAVNLTGVPGYAQVYVSDTEGSFGSVPVAKTNHLGQIIQRGDGINDPEAIEATNVLVAQQEDKTTLYYKITKAGYNDFTGSVTPDGDAATINASSMVVDTATVGANVIWYDNADWARIENNTVFGQWTYRAANGIRCQTKRYYATLGTSILTATHYKFSFKINNYGTTVASKTTRYVIKDENGKAIATFDAITDSSKAFTGSKLYVGEGTDPQTIDASGGGTLEIDVNTTTGAVSASYGGVTSSGTVEGVGMVRSVGGGTTGDMNNQIGVDAFKVLSVE